MKKFISIILIICMMAAMTACTESGGGSPDIGQDSDIGKDDKDRKPIEKIELCYLTRSNNLQFRSASATPSADGSNEAYCMEISGLKDEKVQKAINDKIKEVCDSYINNPDYIPAYLGSAIRFRGMENAEARRWVDVTLKASRDNILSLYVYYTYSKQSTGGNYRYANASEMNCLNFDLRTGKLLSIGDLFSDPEAGIDYIDEKVEEYIRKNNAMDEYTFDYEMVVDPVLFRSDFPGIKPDQQFLISPDRNEVILVFDHTTPYVSTTEAPEQLPISLDRVCDLRRSFESDEWLFTDGEAHMAFLNSDELSVKTETVSINDGMMAEMMSFLNNTYIIPISSYARSEDLNEEQNAFLNLDGRFEGLQKECEDYYNEFSAGEFEGKGFDGEIVLRSTVSCLGPYVNLTKTYTKNLNLTDEWAVVDKQNLSEGRCYRFGSDKQLALEDIFKPGMDIKSVLKAAMIAGAKEIDPVSSFGRYGSSLREGYDYDSEEFSAFFDELLDHISGFNLGADFFMDSNVQYINLFFDCDPCSILKQYLPEFYDAIYVNTWYTQARLNMIDGEYLTIFE